MQLLSVSEEAYGSKHSSHILIAAKHTHARARAHTYTESHPFP